METEAGESGARAQPRTCTRRQAAQSESQPHLTPLCRRAQPLAGFASTSADATAAAISCPANSYCPAGADGPKPCPAHTESPGGSDAIDDCVAAAGYYGVPGQPAEPCGEGYYCPEGSEEQTECPANTVSSGDPPPLSKPPGLYALQHPPREHREGGDSGGAGGSGARDRGENSGRKGLWWRAQEGGSSVSQR